MELKNIGMNRVVSSVAWIVETFGETSTYILEQDNVPIHQFTYMNGLLHDQSIWPLKLHERSYDLNLIEKVCGSMASMVYVKYKQIEDVFPLKEVVREVWESRSQEYLVKMYRSVPRRLVQDMYSNEGDKKYWTVKNKLCTMGLRILL